MSLTRDAIQGFIDGYLFVGGTPEKLKETVDVWMKDHHTYPMDEVKRNIIINDLESYKGVRK